MSETLSTEELAQLKANHGEGKPCAGMCLESKAVATIEALQAEVTTLRTALHGNTEAHMVAVAALAWATSDGRDSFACEVTLRSAAKRYRQVMMEETSDE